MASSFEDFWQMEAEFRAKVAKPNASESEIQKLKAKYLGLMEELIDPNQLNAIARDVLC